MKWLWLLLAIPLAFALSCWIYGTREMIDWLKRFND
jgi:hypothetical protein